MFAAAQATPSAALDRSGEVLLLHELAEPVGPPTAAAADGPPAIAGRRLRHVPPPIKPKPMNRLRAQ